MPRLAPVLCFCAAVLSWLGGAGCVNKGAAPATAASPGPLRVHPTNPHYLTDGTTTAAGALKAIYLTGSHTWLNLQDGNTREGLPPFDYNAYLDFLQRYHHNFIRLWAWEGSIWVRNNSERVMLGPLPFVRSGPGLALDGKPRIDVTRFDEAYFRRHLEIGFLPVSRCGNRIVSEVHAACSTEYISRRASQKVADKLQQFIA